MGRFPFPRAQTENGVSKNPEVPCDRGSRRSSKLLSGHAASDKALFPVCVWLSETEIFKIQPSEDGLLGEGGGRGQRTTRTASLPIILRGLHYILSKSLTWAKSSPESTWCWKWPSLGRLVSSPGLGGGHGRFKVIAAAQNGSKCQISILQIRTMILTNHLYDPSIHEFLRDLRLKLA